ncbi:unnamed protein product [Ixodes persulcatus]
MGAAGPPERNDFSSAIPISSPLQVDGDGVAATAVRWPGVGGDRLSPAPGSGATAAALQSVGGTVARAAGLVGRLGVLT